MTGSTIRVDTPRPSPVQRAGARIWRLAGFISGVVPLACAAPATCGLIIALWVTGVATGSLLNGPAPDLAALVAAGLGPLRAGHWWSPVTSMFWCSSLPSYLITTVAVLALVPGVERRLGSARSAVVLVFAQVAGVLTGLMVIELGGVGGGSWGRQIATSVAVGPTGAVLALALASSAVFGAHWRRRVRVVAIVALVMLALYSGLLSDLLRLSTGLVGLGLGAWLWRDRTHGRERFSKPEVRVLLALIVAASAIGPLIAAFAQTRIGPLSLLRYVFASPPPDVATVRQICADPSLAPDCAHLQARLRLHGLGPGLMSAMPVVLLLAAAEGLRLGRRAAWLAAIGLNLTLAALGIVLAVSTISSPPRERLMVGPVGHHLHAWLVFLLPLVQPLLMAALLAATRSLFCVRAPRGTYLNWGIRVALTLLGTSAVYVAGSTLLADDYQPQPSFPDILVDLPTRFLPPGYLGAVDPVFLPAQPLTTLLFEWTGVVFWAVLVAGAVSTFARTPHLAFGPAARIQDLLAVGGGSMSYPVTWAGNSYWFTDDRSAAIAYRVIGGVAITTGDPIGDRNSRRAAVRGFIRHCEEQNWVPCLYGVSGEVAAHAVEEGWQRTHVAEETIIPLGDLAFTGKRWQNMRTALNHAKRVGITAEWCRFSQAPTAITDQIRAISTNWIANKGVPEMGFTLGGLTELADTEVQLLIAVDADRTVHAVTSWLPVRRGGRLIGYTLDFMRRRPEAFNGSMDFLIGSAARDCQDEGLEFVSLSGSPLARLDRGEASSRMQQALDLLGRTLEPIYGFRSLLAFKARFHPEYQPLYLAYSDHMALPRIGYAVARAYLPHLTPRQCLDLARLLLAARRARARTRPGTPRAEIRGDR